MRVFTCVAELGSITKAAHLLDTTQSAVSRQVGALEAEIGGRLFHRTGRGVVLTELGRRIEPRIRSLLVELDRIGTEAKEMASIPAGDVHIGMLSSIAPRISTRLLQGVRRQYPEVRLHLFDGFSGQLDEKLANGRLDMALLFRYGESRGSDGETLAVLHSYLVGPPGDRLTRDPIVPFATLDHLPLVLPMFPNGIRASLDETARREQVAISLAVEADSIPVQIALASDPAEPVYAISSYYAVADAVRAGQLQAARIVSPGIDRSFCLAHSARRPASLATRKLAELVAQIARELVSMDPQT
jgi:LysR family nitrogen assimilation transcriptional regulator